MGIAKLRGVAHWLDEHSHGRLEPMAQGVWVKIAALVVILLCMTVPPLEVLPFASSGPMLAIAAIGRAGELWGLTLSGSCIAVLYNLVVFLLVQQIASIGYQALAQFNTVVVVGGAALFIDHLHEPAVWAGTIVCLLASSCYVWLSYIVQAVGWRIKRVTTMLFHWSVPESKGGQ